MLGLGFFSITGGALLLWAGYNDLDVLKVLDSILSKTPIEAHKPGGGLDRIGRAALVIFALKTTAGALGGLLKGGVLPGGRGGSGTPGEGEVPAEGGGEVPVPEPVPVPIAAPRVPTVTV